MVKGEVVLFGIYVTPYEYVRRMRRREATKATAGGYLRVPRATDSNHSGQIDERTSDLLPSSLVSGGRPGLFSRYCFRCLSAKIGNSMAPANSESPQTA